MAATEIHPGGTYSFNLDGRESTYTLTATVTSVTGDRLVLETLDGKSFAVPRAVVSSVTRTAPKPISSSQSQPTPQDQSRPPTMAELAQTLHDAISGSALTGDALGRVRLIRRELANISDKVTSRLNGEVVRSLIQLCQDFEGYLAASDGADASARRVAILEELRKIRALRVHPSPSRSLPIEIQSIASLLGSIDKEHWEETRAPFDFPPRILTRDRINVTREAGNEFELPIRIMLEKGANDVSNVKLILDKFRHLKVIGALPTVARLRGGETATLKARVRDVRKQGAKGDLRLDAHVIYRTTDGSQRQSARQTLDLRIHGKEAHQEILNPFRAYAGGLPVERPDMFFGRAGLVQELVRELARPPVEPALLFTANNELVNRASWHKLKRYSASRVPLWRACPWALLIDGA